MVNYNTSSYVKKIRGLKETPQTLALRALRTISRSTPSELQLDRIPKEILKGTNLNLEHWTLLLKDEDFIYIIQYNQFRLNQKKNDESTQKELLLSLDKGTIKELFQSFFIPTEVNFEQSIISLKIPSSKELTDQGLSIIAHSCPKLKLLDVSNCPKLTDIGLRELAIHCPLLINLNLSNCSNLNGECLIALAESCTNLISLNISHCNNFQSWALMKIFKHCTMLEVVNISHCRNIGDEEVRILAESCSNLLQFYAKECPYISDQSIMYLSRNCVDLDLLDLSRTDMASRITDVSLMAIGQRLTSLRILKLNGCDSLTDVGIGWLTEHSKLLETLELSKCSRLTDASMRVLGQRCHALVNLDISGLKSLSDIGLASLSRGCKGLKSLKCHETILLSDPRLTSKEKASKDHKLNREKLKSALLFNSNSMDFLLSSQSNSMNNSSSTNLDDSASYHSNEPDLMSQTYSSNSSESSINKPAFTWETIIGVQALANNCQALEELDFSGCFRLNNVLGTSLSTLSSLKILNLKGCSQLSSLNLIKIASGCPMLSVINLADCVRAVTNESLVALASNCIYIKELILSRCIEIRSLGIKAISSLHYLEKLDLNACIHLNDSIMVHITNGERLPNLVTLDVSNCTNLSDSFITWLAMKPHKILTLHFSGCYFSNKALYSIRDRFPNCDLTQNNKFFGFLPKHRVQNRILINNFSRLITSITKIQSYYRKYKATEYFKWLKENIFLIKTACLIQRVFRGYKGRQKVKSIKEFLLKEYRAAIKITSLFRILIARKIYQEKVQLKNYILKNNLIIKIQTRWRIVLAKEILRILKDKKIQLKIKRLKATIVIQSLFRRKLAYIKVEKIRALLQYNKKFFYKKVQLIQRIFRGYLKRKEVKEYREMISFNERLRSFSTSLIQKNYRIYLLNKKIKERIIFKQKKLRAIIKIQSLIRGALTRLETIIIKYERNEERKRKASITIQCFYRVYRAKIKYHNKLLIKKAHLDHIFKNSCIINLFIKRQLAKIKLNRKRYEYNERVRKDIELKLNSIIKIQSVVRTFLTQKKYKEKLLSKKNKWKELYDEKLQKKFFYNKLTGEIRWRIPQDLLDLIPHPICDNCSHVEALIECRECCELFCGQCFTLIHQGGRRKAHSYRSMYDYYGRRLDYGDGVFPSQWPTEIIQDEIQGWMLRVAPYREPIEVFSSNWELYDIKEEEKKLLEKRTSIIKKNLNQDRIRKTFGNNAPTYFFFNRTTFETSYEIPSEVAKELNARQEQEAYIARYSYNGPTSSTLPSTAYPSPVSNRKHFPSTKSSFNFGDNNSIPSTPITPSSIYTMRNSGNFNNTLETAFRFDDTDAFNQTGTPYNESMNDDSDDY